MRDVLFYAFAFGMLYTQTSTYIWNGNWLYYNIRPRQDLPYDYPIQTPQRRPAPCQAVPCSPLKPCLSPPCQYIPCPDRSDTTQTTPPPPSTPQMPPPIKCNDCDYPESCINASTVEYSIKEVRIYDICTVKHIDIFFL